MTYSLKVSFADKIEPTRVVGARFICEACCDLVKLRVNEIGYCISECPVHPSIMIRDGKVVGTSA